MVSSKSLLIVLAWTLCVVNGQNLIKNPKEINLEGRLLISEVNPDNPGHDTSEFIELRHTSGQNFSLNGYTLVFYNGKTNTAYKVLNLTGYSTDKKGFFLIGSSDVKPKPAVILPPNSIQNGPDAIALYFGKGPYKESMYVTRDGLVDVLVHKSKSFDQADVLLSSLTPGAEAFLEDASFHTSDESMGRCLDIDGRWTFHMTHLSPGTENHCKVFPVMINEVSSPYATDLYVEIRGPPSFLLSGLTLAFISGMDKEVYYSTDIRGQTDASGLFLLVNEKHDNRAQQTLADAARLHTKGGGAVALYMGKSSDSFQKSRYTTSGLVNALVYGDYEDMAFHNLQDLVMGNNIIYWHNWDVNISASLCAQGQDGLTAFILAENTPGQVNECPPVITRHNVTLCFRILTDASLTCQPRLLTLHASQNVTSALGDIEQYARMGSLLTVRNKIATVTPTCTQPTAFPTQSPEFAGDTSPSSNAPVLLISEVNPNNPGSAEDTEYVELYHTSNSSASLDGYWLVLYNGRNNMAYFALNLKGFYTDKNGFFLVGSAKMTPQPHIPLRANTIQNGADAVALYYRPGKPYFANMQLTEDGLVDAVVYVSQARDDASGLLAVLTPGQDAVHENEQFIEEDESLSRCHGLVPLDHSTFQITKTTPLIENNCEAVPPSTPTSVTSGHPRASSPPGTSSLPTTLLISEVGVMQGSVPYVFVELKGPPGDQIWDHTLVMYNRDGKVYDRFGLKGVIGANGLYLISVNDTGDQKLPLHFRPYNLTTEALALYRGRPESFPLGSSLTQKDLLDVILYTWERSASTEVLRDLRTPIVTLYGDQALVSVSRCAVPKGSNAQLLPVQHPSPGRENFCPSTVTSVQLDLCVKGSTMDCSGWETMKKNTLDKLKTTLSQSMEKYCLCFTPPSYIQELDGTCTKEKIALSGNVLTTHSDQHLIQRWNSELLSHDVPLQDSSLGHYTGCFMTEKRQGAFKAWQVSLLVLLLLLVICGVAGFILFLRKRTPQNYTSFEMNHQTDLTSDY
ncbi:uncharacterized protein LOC134945606 isoform X2 [Pseudophryne corroboree]|uniref:uncharacterized protein LOC134945606 isoform X2 n=1 Tax=Pseudophryne corroboree TaxID=495146 RepID=UPI00308200AE